jgi:hypothetical protein
MGVAVNYGHPIAPTEFPKGWSAATTRSAPGSDNHEAVTYTPQEEDTKGWSRRRIDGYQPRLTPGNLDRILAKGQSSTDLIFTEALEASRISVNPLPHQGLGLLRPLPRLESSTDHSAIGIWSGK